jgi:hypothetical protein
MGNSARAREIERRWTDLLLIVGFFRESRRQFTDAGDFRAKFVSVDYGDRRQIAESERFYEQVINQVLELDAELMKMIAKNPEAVDEEKRRAVVKVSAQLGIIKKDLVEDWQELHDRRDDLQHDYSYVPGGRIWTAAEQLDELIDSWLARYHQVAANLGHRLPDP